VRKPEQVATAWQYAQEGGRAGRGKGQSVVRKPEQVATAWQYAQEGGRAGRGRVIIEGFVPFDYEITLLTISAVDGIHFCAPIGHRQEDGDYRESWQPQAMSDELLAKSQHVAREVVKALGGYGLFGVELFIKGDEVYFSEVSPRPHDTGMVTLISQDLSEFALHVRRSFVRCCLYGDGLRDQPVHHQGQAVLRRVYRPHHLPHPPLRLDE
jgi:formate-dependent phosphoribosylglycinamide formyltransferase (GAR transformylase)